MVCLQVSRFTLQNVYNFQTLEISCWIVVCVFVFLEFFVDRKIPKKFYNAEFWCFQFVLFKLSVFVFGLSKTENKKTIETKWLAFCVEKLFFMESCFGVYCFLKRSFFSNWIKIMVRVFVFAFLSNVCFRKFKKKFCLLIHWKNKVFKKMPHFLFWTFSFFLTDDKQIKYKKRYERRTHFSKIKLKMTLKKHFWSFVLDYIKMFFDWFSHLKKKKNVSKEQFYSKNFEASHNSLLFSFSLWENEKRQKKNKIVACFKFQNFPFETCQISEIVRKHFVGGWCVAFWKNFRIHEKT